jgi:hypothetical protein
VSTGVPLPLSSSRYMARECTISALMNGAMSALVFAMVFGLDKPVIALGVRGYAVDFFIQGFAVGIAATAIPGLLAGKAIRVGKVEPHGVRVQPARRLLMRTLVTALLAGLASGAVWWLALAALGISEVPVPAGICIKAGFGGALAAALTRLVLRSDRSLQGTQSIIIFDE